MQTTDESQARLSTGFSARRVFDGIMDQAERSSKLVFLMPAVLALLFLSIFPLIISFYLSLTRFKFIKGGFTLDYVGLANYKDLFIGTEQVRFLGQFSPMGIGTWLLLVLVAAGLLAYAVNYVRRGRISFAGIFGRTLLIAGSGALAYMFVRTLTTGGRLGSVGVTLMFVFVGIALQYGLGLGLAILTSQNLKGRRFFRVVFLLPMMITPVGIAYMFRMVSDTGKGPLKPLWIDLGLTNFTWVTDPWGARAAVILADTWQWVPFMFIVLLAALESQSVETVEAATVDGANPWQIFWNITWPGIFPISLTLCLIRMIEAFKIIDLPNVMTGGGPGTSTESLTLHSFINWRALDIGSSAAIAYMLLILVTFFATAFVQMIRQRSLGNG